MAALDDFEARIRSLVDDAREVYGAEVQRITIDPQASGQCPYQITVVGEDVPLAGLVTLNEQAPS